LYTFAVAPNNAVRTAYITVNGITLTTYGQMPGNQFILGVTHVIHEVDVTTGSLSVSIAGECYLNGFQLQAVPEPASLLGLSLGALMFAKRKRTPNRTRTASVDMAAWPVLN
jgi:hypothetical protein